MYINIGFFAKLKQLDLLLRKKQQLRITP